MPGADDERPALVQLALVGPAKPLEAPAYLRPAPPPPPRQPADVVPLWWARQQLRGVKPRRTAATDGRPDSA